ncbi:PREDICTED: coiled-coil domain-containing protein 14 isoform X1 [Lepidothrix coronata]|uniref:Coiled-coil domain-containing protein 14 isoform X1 n=2 Tax=Lepidothrix coronata TaxID=321398 RepID=A0A6J0HQE3_9PASS|nr:PREDICTED: coiled-coil domain-containing protein 14 isoform X1 [Lepidothrix coronata]
MAAAGAARPRKGLSSGRLSGAVKLTNGRKQFGLRRGCYTDAEFFSTDSDNQVDAIHDGLDQCAALLKNFIQNGATGKEAVHKQPGKAPTSKPLLTKGNTSKKKGLTRNVTPAPVRKEILPISNRKFASSTTPSAEKELSSAAQNQMVQPIHVPCSQHSPVMYQKLCEHVETQMSLITGQPPQESNEIPTITPSPTSNQGCQNVAAFNYLLPLSTSGLSLQHSANPLTTQSGVPVDSASGCVPEMGGPVVFPVVSAAPAVQVQSGTALPSVVPCIAPGPSIPTVPTLIPASSAREMTPSQEHQIKEADLIRCIQAHLALLQSREGLNGSTEQRCHQHCPAQHDGSSDTEEDTPEEHSEDVVSEEDELNVLDIAPVRDTGCRTSCVKKVLKSRRESPEETAHKVMTVKYLMGELRELITDQDDPEMLRLMSEIEGCISLLPAVVGSTNIQAEIALALQPLRSENAQLRRRLRILNQKLREQDTSEKKSGQSCNYELVSLQSLNMMLQSQLKESQKGLDSLQAKNEELLKIVESQKEENKHLAKVIQDKEEELLENKQHYDIHSTKLKIEVEEALGNVKSLQFKLEASEKENKILGITLRQRDAEVKRLRELTRTLQGSMAKLLSDLTADNVRPKPEKALSKSLLEDHEKQMQPEPFPGSTAVMTYLKKLEMDHILIDTDLQFANESGNMEMQNLAYEKFDAEGSKINSTFKEEGTSAPRALQTSLNQDAETVSDSGTLLDDQNKLDETIYIPLTSSASKKQQPVSERTGVLPQSRGACKTLDFCELPSSVPQCGCELSKDPTVLDKLSAGYSVKKTVENTLEVTGDKAKLEGDKVQMRSKVIPSGAAKDSTDKPDQPQPGTYPRVSMPFPTEISQRKGSKPADFSCISFDGLSVRSEWSATSFSTFTSRDEEDFKNSLAALDANIAKLQRTLQSNIRKQ